MFDTGDDSELPEDIKKEFIKSGVLLPESDEERFKRLKFLSYLTRFNSRIIGLTIAPTMSCNFKCVYCYEGDRVQNVSLTEEVIDGLINFIKKRDCKTLNITWYGGEPLCAWNKVLEITKEIEKLGIPNIHYSMITNGSLINDDVIKFVDEKKFDYVQITLDGDEEIHNSRRPMKNGKNSFQAILSSLDKIYNYCQKNNTHINVSLRVNLDKSNVSAYKKVCNMIHSKYQRFFYIYPAFVYRNSESDRYSSDCMSSLESSCAILDLVNKDNIFTSKLIPLKNRLYACSVQHINYFVVDSSGDIYKCWNEISDKEKCLGNVITGFRDDKNITAFNVMESSGFEDDECKNCLFLYSCMGGCPKFRSENKKLGKEINMVCYSIKNNPKEYLESYFKYKERNSITE